VCLPLVVSAAEPGQVPGSALAQMGVAGLQPMSDAQGESIRGMGFHYTAPVVSSAAVSGSTYVAMTTTQTGPILLGDATAQTSGGHTVPTASSSLSTVSSTTYAASATGGKYSTTTAVAGGLSLANSNIGFGVFGGNWGVLGNVSGPIAISAGYARSSH
jgi:hypothetical protein